MDHISLKNVHDAVNMLQNNRNNILSLSSIHEPLHSNRSLYLRITRSNVTELRELLKQGKITSEEIVQVLTYQCSTIGRKLNGISEPNFTEALNNARKFDHRTTWSYTNNNSLSGIPLSVKDEINQIHFFSTCGIMRNTVQQSNSFAKEDSGILQLLREAGCIPFVRSNVPQAFKTASETDNYIFGRTNNPYNSCFTCGGSSGGEAALIASYCSCVGIGTDIAIPSHFCGISAFRPTANRTTLQGIRSNSLNEEGHHFLTVPGPLARCVNDLVLILKVWWPPLLSPSETVVPFDTSIFPSSGQQQVGESSTSSAFISTVIHSPRGLWDIDPRVPPLPFHTSVYESFRSLRIGYFVYDQFFTPAVSVQRAVKLAASVLKKQGHTVVPWNPVDKGEINLRKAALAYGIFINKDTIKDVIKNQLQGYEPLHRLYRTIVGLASIPDSFGVRKFTEWIYRYIFRYPRIADIIHCTGSYTLSDAYRWNAQRNQMCTNLLDAMQKDNIDILLCPTVGLPAWPHGYTNYLEPATSYSWLWSYLALPAGVVPVTFTERNEHTRVPYHTTVDTSYESNDPITKFTQSTLEELDQAVLNSGQAFPLTVQLVGKPYKDELVLNCMKSLETGIQIHETIIAERILKGPPHTVPFPVNEPSSPLYIYD